MPALNAAQLRAVVLDAVTAAGGHAVPDADGSRHPLRFHVLAPDAGSVWIYIWTLSHGGRDALPNEYRIQMTSVASPLAMNPNGLTAIMGFDPDSEIFAGFDVSRHGRFTAGSPSVQIDARTFIEARRDSMAFDLKANGEIAVAIRPDALLVYLHSAAELHGAAPTDLPLLTRAATSQPVSEADVQALPAPRRRLISSVSRMSRDRHFRPSVLTAYNHTCALSGLQLDLVEAAHIVPVSAGADSPDIVPNGIALSPNVHSAYDSGLIYLDTDFRFKINALERDRLQATGRVAGTNDFAMVHETVLSLPRDRRHWPTVELIELAKRVRRVPA